MKKSNLLDGFKVTVLDETAVCAFTMKVYELMFRFFSIRLVAPRATVSRQSDHQYYNINTSL